MNSKMHIMHNYVHYSHIMHYIMRYVKQSALYKLCCSAWFNINNNSSKDNNRNRTRTNILNQQMTKKVFVNEGIGTLN